MQNLGDRAKLRWKKGSCARRLEICSSIVPINAEYRTLTSTARISNKLHSSRLSKSASPFSTSFSPSFQDYLSLSLAERLPGKGHNRIHVMHVQIKRSNRINNEKNFVVVSINSRDYAPGLLNLRRRDRDTDRRFNLKVQILQTIESSSPIFCCTTNVVKLEVFFWFKLGWKNNRDLSKLDYF